MIFAHLNISFQSIIGFWGNKAVCVAPLTQYCNKIIVYNSEPKSLKKKKKSKTRDLKYLFLMMLQMTKLKDILGKFVNFF